MTHQASSCNYRTRNLQHMSSCTFSGSHTRPSRQHYSPILASSSFGSSSSWDTPSSSSTPLNPSPPSFTSTTYPQSSPSYRRTKPSTSATIDDDNDNDVLIEFKNVHKKFGTKEVLTGASFKIRRGEAVGIIGGSGTGKSTTLRLAAGLIPPDSGEVIIKGRPRLGLLADDDTSSRLKIGLVFQSGALFDSLTVGQNVGFLLYEHTNLPEDRIKQLVARSLSHVGLSGVEDLYPSELSGGMRKRVALARAIVEDDTHQDVDRVIMYDEPTAGLDPVASTVVENLIRSLQIGGTNGNGNGTDSSGDSNGNGTDTALANGTSAIADAYIVVTHQHSTIRRSVDRLVFLHAGTVAWEGSVEEFDTTEEPIVRQFSSGSLDGPITYV